MNETRYRTLKLEMENVSAKIDAKASQLSVDDIAKNVVTKADVADLEGDIKSTKRSVDMILEKLNHFQR